MQLTRRQPETLLDSFVSVVFWMLIVMVLLNVKGLFPTGTNGYLLIIATQSICCLLLAGLVHVRLSQALGTPGALLLGAVASYLLIGLTVSIVTGAELRVDLDRYLKNYAFPLPMIAAAALGGRAILHRVEIETFLKSLLLILTASSILILLSPILISLDVLPRNVNYYQFTYSIRLVGTFLDPTSAGFISCLTAVWALAFLCNSGRPRVLGYMSLFAGFGATLGSLSKTAIISFAASLIFFLLLNGHGGRGPILLWLGALILIGAIILQTTGLNRFLQDPQARQRLVEVTQFVSGKMIDDDVLTGRGELWKLGLRKALQSPIVGQGSGRLHNMVGAPFGTNNKPLGTHNMYLLLVGEAGILPLSLYLLYLFSLLRLRWTVPKTLARDAIVSSTILIGLLSFTSDHLLNLWFFPCLCGLTCAMTATLMEGRRPNLHEEAV